MNNLLIGSEAIEHAKVLPRFIYQALVEKTITLKEARSFFSEVTNISFHNPWDKLLSDIALIIQKWFTLLSHMRDDSQIEWMIQTIAQSCMTKLPVVISPK